MAESAVALVVLDAHALTAGAQFVRYRGVPEPVQRSVRVSDGMHLPDVIGPDQASGRWASSLRFDAAKQQSLALHNAYNQSLDDQNLENPYARLTISASVRFNRVELEPGETMVIVSKRKGATGWALDLTNPGDGTVLRMVANGWGIDDLLPKTFEVTMPVVTAEFDTMSSFFIFGEFRGDGLSLTTRGHEASMSREPLMGTKPRDNDMPVTLGADPDASDGFFDGEIQMVRVVTTRW